MIPVKVVSIGTGGDTSGMDGWFPLDQALATDLGRIYSPSLIRLISGAGEIASLVIEHPAALRHFRFPIAFMDRHFDYLVVSTDSLADGSRPSMAGCTLVHASSDSLGFVVVDRARMDRYVDEAGPTHLIDRFTEGEDGDQLFNDGAVFPLLGITPWTYRFLFAVELSPVVEPWAGPSLVRRGPFSPMGGQLELMLGSALEAWPARSLALGLSLPQFAVDLHATGPHGVGLATFVFLPSDGTGDTDEPILNSDPALLYEANNLPVDEVWVPAALSGQDEG